MSLHKFYYLIAALLCVSSFTACSDDDDQATIPNIELTGSLSSMSEGILSFDEEYGILTVDTKGSLTSGISFNDANGVSLDDITLKAEVPAEDKMWCIAKFSKTRLSLSIATNAGENVRQTVIEVSAYYGDRLLDTYSLSLIQASEEKSEEGEYLANITHFLIPGQVSSKVDYPIINVTMPEGTDLTALKPVIVISAGATVIPGDGEIQDFSDVVDYEVTSLDGKLIRKYRVVISTKVSGGGSDPSVGEEDNPSFIPFDMVEVEAGSFIMGQDPSGQFADKENSHKVNISAFEIGRYEVTQREFEEVMGYNPSVNKKNDLYPVHKVTLFEAMNYCNELSKRDGYTPVYTFNNAVWDEATGKELLEADVLRNENANGYRLPTNAEWEYAAKGGKDNALYPFWHAGSNDLDEVAWHIGNSIVGLQNTMHVVGLKKANALGIYDMSGNIEEYTGEWLLTIDYASDAEETDPWGPVYPRDEEQYVISRGGNYIAESTTCAVPNWRILTAFIKTDFGQFGTPGGTIWFEKIGFRVVRSLK